MVQACDMAYYIKGCLFLASNLGPSGAASTGVALDIGFSRRYDASHTTTAGSGEPEIQNTTDVYLP